MKFIKFSVFGDLTVRFCEAVKIESPPGLIEAFKFLPGTSKFTTGLLKDADKLLSLLFKFLLRFLELEELVLTF